MSEQYRMISPTMAVARSESEGKMHFVTVPSGAVLKITGAPQQSGLVDVFLDGQIVAMFFRDIEERGEKILPVGA